MSRWKAWSTEETDYLLDAWGQTSITTISKRLGRSPDAIKIKAKKLGLGGHLHSSDKITFLELVQTITGGPNSYSWCREKWARYDFPFRRQRVQKSSFLMVSIPEFWEWAEKHQDILDFSKFEEYALGVEPAWAKAKRRRDYQHKRREARPWTPLEDEKLRQMLEAQRYNLDEIAAELNRREGAIRRRIDTLGIMHRPIRNPGKKWTEEEIETLLKMHREGHSFEDIGARIGRTASACRGRYERLLNPYSMTRDVRNNKEALKGFFQRHQCSHYSAGLGCDVRGTNCDECLDFRHRDPAGAYTTGWISTKAGTDGQERILQPTT